MPGRDISFEWNSSWGPLLHEVSANISGDVHCLLVDRMQSWIDLGLMGLTFVLSMIWNVEVGIVVSMVLSLVLVVHRSSKTRMTILVSIDRLCQLHVLTYPKGRIPGTDRWKSINENPEAEEDVPGVLIVRIRDNLDFGQSSCRMFLLIPWHHVKANTAQLKGTHFILNQKTV